jgi:glutamine synthetase
MLLIPDPSTAVLDRFHEQRTLSLVCDVIDPITREPYSRDPRHVARKAERHLAASRIADTCYVGPEAEFYIFDDVSFNQHAHTAFYKVDSIEGHWNGGRPQQGYFLAPPADAHADLRARMAAALEEMEIPCEVQHHEVGSAGQAEINMRFTTLLQMADRPATRHRSRSRTPAATAPPRCGSRCIPAPPGQSESSSARPTQPPGAAAATPWEFALYYES